MTYMDLTCAHTCKQVMRSATSAEAFRLGLVRCVATELKMSEVLALGKRERERGREGEIEIERERERKR